MNFHTDAMDLHGRQRTSLAIHLRREHHRLPDLSLHGQDVELFYYPNSGECDIKEDLTNLNFGDRFKVKGMMKVELINVKGMLTIRPTLTIEDIDEGVPEQAEEFSRDYGSSHDDEAGIEEYNHHGTSNTDNYNVAHHLDRPPHDDPYHNNSNTNNPNIARAVHDHRYHSTSNAHKCSIAYHPYNSVHIDPVHEMGVRHRGRSIKRPCTPYLKTNSKQHHRGMSASRFGSNSAIGHREVPYYRHGHAKLFGSAKESRFGVETK
ncbi:hypothetical protein EC957_001295 [Mortierella hygrophila]|uniref:Uncharacterized protein n=1 Tax=Mortierella hygrophila TaxID=979708 RepID=A0A9P6F6J2_9FUNG|nr:hypothetical protein EC957_001295 [Mortierella hygrophila]